MNISFVVPVYNTNYQILRVCINSILNFLDKENELIIVDDASNSPETIAFLNSCKSVSGYNIKLLNNLENNGVCYSLNKGINESTCDFIIPVDHDDLVIPNGIKVAIKHQQYFGAPWLYTDEIQVDEKGYFIRYLTKPSYSKTLLQSNMYINHLQMFSRHFVNKIGRYREGLEGSQDHDLALRMSQLKEPCHVPAIGYHWRITQTTQSRQIGLVTKKTIEASQKALHDHFSNDNKTISVTNTRRDLSVYKIRIVPKSLHKISIIIPSKLGTRRTIRGISTILLENCLKSIKNTLPKPDCYFTVVPEIEIILVINKGDDIDAANHIIYNSGLIGSSVTDKESFNFSRKCNLGAQICNGDILIFLNDDTEFISNDWAKDVVSLLLEDDVACVGGMLLNEDGTVQSCGDNVSLNAATHYNPNPSPDNEGDPFHRYHADHETTSVTGAFFCCRKKTFWSLDGFSETFSNSFQDVDFCLRSRKQGYRCLTSPHIKLFHFESSTRDAKVDDETLLSLRSFHKDTISNKDDYSLWAYQPVRVSLWSLAGIVHAKNQIRIHLGWLRRALHRYISSGPRARFKPIIK